MKIYEIDARLDELLDGSVDEETGEIVTDFDEIEKLQMERDAIGMSNRRGRDSMGRYTSRDGGGYSGHGSVEDIMDDLRDMPEPERKRVKQMLERM